MDVDIKPLAAVEEVIILGL